MFFACVKCEILLVPSVLFSNVSGLVSRVHQSGNNLYPDPDRDMQFWYHRTEYWIVYRAFWRGGTALLLAWDC